jgi:membrane protease YdiL (CAAX protease family)
MANSAEQSLDPNSLNPKSADPKSARASSSALVRFAQARPLTLFFLFAYAWAWTWWLIALLAIYQKARIANSDAFGISLFITGAFGPTLAALITRRLTYRDLKICSFWTGWRSFIVGLALGLLCFFITVVVAPACALVKAPLFALHWATLAHWGTYAVNYSNFLGGPIPEEPGWRGFALPILQKRYGPFRATLVLAPLWAGWHLPMFLVEGWTTATPWEFLLILVGVSFLLTAAANLSRFSVLVAIVLHAFFNTSPAMLNAMTHDLPPRPHQQVSYALAVLVCGTVLGLATLAAWRLHNFKQGSDDFPQLPSHTTFPNP